METSLTCNRDGTLYASTRTWSENWVIGFTGGVVAMVADASGNILHRTGVQSYGVDGKGIFWKPSSRIEFWQEAVPADRMPAAQGLYVHHFHNGRPRFGEIVAEAMQSADDVASVLGALAALGVI
jgi:hypothetical protein